MDTDKDGPEHRTASSEKSNWCWYFIQHNGQFTNFAITKDEGPHKLPTLLESLSYPLTALKEWKDSCGYTQRF